VRLLVACGPVAFSCADFVDARFGGRDLYPFVVEGEGAVHLPSVEGVHKGCALGSKLAFEGPLSLQSLRRPPPKRAPRGRFSALGLGFRVSG
jgi:hypothetical protein